jgi:hypothetical protein
MPTGLEEHPARITLGLFFSPTTSRIHMNFIEALCGITAHGREPDGFMVVRLGF